MSIFWIASGLGWPEVFWVSQVYRYIKCGLASKLLRWVFSQWLQFHPPVFTILTFAIGRMWEDNNIIIDPHFTTYPKLNIIVRVFLLVSGMSKTMEKLGIFFILQPWHFVSEKVHQLKKWQFEYSRKQKENSSAAAKNFLGAFFEFTLELNKNCQKP